MKIAKLKRGKPYLFIDVETWGGKGDNLLKLNEVFKVPPGFIISSDTYSEWVSGSNLSEVVQQTLSQKSPEEAYEEIKANYGNTTFPESLVERLKNEFERLQKPVAVRSSSVDEDGSKNSFAGQHESVLGVSSLDEFLGALREVYASLFTPRAIEYRKTKAINNGDAIAVVVQEMVDAVVSGVAYSPSPNNLNEILIESTWGLCTSIVDGRACDIYRIVDTVTGDTIQDISPKKFEMDVFDKRKKQIMTKKVPFQKIKSDSLTHQQVLEIAKTVKSIERGYGMPMDMEFAYDSKSDLYVLQARPLTGIVKTEEEVNLPNIPADKILVKSKNTRNQGKFEGPAVVVRRVDHVNKKFDIDGDLVALNEEFRGGYILLAPEVPPQLEQHVTNAKAMYATECGTTGHAAAIATEKGVIYLGRGNSNVPNLLQNIRSGMKVGIAVSKDEGILYIPEDQ